MGDNKFVKCITYIQIFSILLAVVFLILQGILLYNNTDDYFKIFVTVYNICTFTYLTLSGGIINSVLSIRENYQKIENKYFITLMELLSLLADEKTFNYSNNNINCKIENKIFEINGYYSNLFGSNIDDDQNNCTDTEYIKINKCIEILFRCTEEFKKIEDKIFIRKKKINTKINEANSIIIYIKNHISGNVNKEENFTNLIIAIYTIISKYV